MKTTTLTWHKFDLEDKASWPKETGLYLIHAREGLPPEIVYWFEGFDMGPIWRVTHYWAELPEYPQENA